MSDDELSPIPVIDVDQAFPPLTSDGRRGSSSSGGGDGSVTPAVEGALRDVLGWRPRAQDTSAFTAALTASFPLSEVEGHVVATYSPRGFAMQADSSQRYWTEMPSFFAKSLRVISAWWR